MVFVPLILWTAQVLLKDVPLPSFIPHIQHVFNQYLIFDLNFPTITMAAYLAYYFILEPVAAVRTLSNWRDCTSDLYFRFCIHHK